MGDPSDGACPDMVAQRTEELLSAILEALNRAVSLQQTTQLMAHPSADPRLTVAQAAEYSGMHPQSIRQACQRRELEHERRGSQGQIRIRLSRIERWLDRDRVRALRGAS